MIINPTIFLDEIITTVPPVTKKHYDYVLPSCWNNRSADFYRHHLSDGAIYQFLQQTVVENPYCPSIIPDPAVLIGFPNSFMAGCLVGLYVALEYYSVHDEFLPSGYENVMNSAFSYYSKHHGILSSEKAFHSGFLTGTNIVTCFSYIPMAEEELHDIPGLDLVARHVSFRMAGSIALALQSYISAYFDAPHGIQ